MLSIEYVAGLFDGEGCVTILYWKPRNPESRHERYNLYVSIGMTHRKIITMLEEQFGGSVQVNHHERRNANHRPQYIWVVCAALGARFLRAIQPYTVVKREEIDLALEFQDNVDKWRYKLGNQYRKHPQRDAIMSYRRSIRERLQALKHPHTL